MRDFAIILIVKTEFVITKINLNIKLTNFTLNNAFTNLIQKMEHCTTVKSKRALNLLYQRFPTFFCSRTPKQKK